MKQFCCKCYEDVDVIYKEEEKTEKIYDVTITFLEKYYVCKKCGNEFYGDLNDYNILTANNELRKFYGTILVSEIEEIVKKYNVKAEELSLILGLEKGTISKYLEGRNPKKEHSELLKKIKDDSELFNTYLMKYKENNNKEK